MHILGIDTGGTFTDFVYFNGKHTVTHKVLSTPEFPETAIIQGIKELGINLSELKLVHGSTVATNAVLQGKGVSTAYITNKGFADVLTIGRQARAELYNLQPQPLPPPVPAELCLEVDCRHAADGSVLQPLAETELTRLIEQLKAIKPEAVAINLLFSFIDNTFEERIAAAIPETIFTSVSSTVLRERREYERGITTWLNAYIGPLMQTYLSRLEQELKPANVMVMRSSGETCSATLAGEQAVQLLLSGPAAGLCGAQYVAGVIGHEQIITLDMGGTSTDVALIDNDIVLTNDARIGRYPVAVPMVDMHTIGAGGGSIASVDTAGVLQVGPASAGANPGPVCYGLGGTEVTVTDCHLVLGRIPEAVSFGDSIQPDRKAAETALAILAQQLQLTTAEQAAASVIELVNEHMLQALRSISVNKGVDPQDFILCAFGGAGGMHVCELATALGLEKALVPINAGVLSALGMAVAPVGRQHSLTIAKLLSVMDEQTVHKHITALSETGIQELLLQGYSRDEIICQASLDLCYNGQSSTLNMPWSDNISSLSPAFHIAHKKRYGHELDREIEIVNVRVRVMVPGKKLQLPKYDSIVEAQNMTAIPQLQRLDPRLLQPLPGPVIVYDKLATVWVDTDWSCQRDEYGNLLLNKV